MSPNSRHDARAALSAPRTAHLGSWQAVATPLGTFHVAAIDGHVVQSALPTTPRETFLAELAARHPGVQFREEPRDPVLAGACAQLAEYAEGRRRTFDLPVRLEGTAFQRKVWDALARIPFGQTRSYQDIADEIGRPGASRAVGQANHHNPVAPIVPCHRVITSTGTLGGYGGGMDLKRALLDLEGAQVGPPPSLSRQARLPGA
jgi:methylated-DNA-[protein]-cysteine S-methyltransferase